MNVERDGFVIGEGAGAIVIEEYEHALRRGAHIYAELAGGGLGADAYHATSTHPQGLGAAISMRSALADAGLEPSSIDYVNAHATSTPTGDGSEVLALRQVLGAHLGNVSISATKSMTGHLLGAAGIIEAIACLLAMRDGVVPPTTNTTKIDPEIPAAANIVLGCKESRQIDVALNNSFGFGGHNATTILRRIDRA